MVGGKICNNGSPSLSFSWDCTSESLWRKEMTCISAKIIKVDQDLCFCFCTSPLPSYNTKLTIHWKQTRTSNEIKWNILELKPKNKLIIAYCFKHSQGKIHLDTKVTAYPAQTRNSEIIGKPDDCLMIRPTWCHSLFWDQMPLNWCSTGAAPRTHALPPVGVGSWTAPQIAGFLLLTTHSLAWTLVPELSVVHWAALVSDAPMVILKQKIGKNKKK